MKNKKLKYNEMGLEKINKMENQNVLNKDDAESLTLDNYFQQYLSGLKLKFEYLDPGSEVEKLLIKDIILALQAIEGQFIKFDQSEKFFLDSKDFSAIQTKKLSRSCLITALRCCESGFYYRRIKALLATFEHSGLVKQMFCGVICDELSIYYQFLANTDSLLNKKDARIETELEIEFPLTVQKMLFLLDPVKAKLGFLLEQCKAVQFLKGGSLCSELHSRIRYEHEPFYSLSLKIFHHCSQPVFANIFDWFLKGRINDPFGEFFIECNSQANQSHADAPSNDAIDSTDLKFSFREAMIPTFISRGVLDKIMDIGKTADCILRHSGDQKQLFYFESIKDELKIEDPHSIEEAIVKIEEKIGKHFIAILFDKFAFYSHFGNIKQYVLLFRGDFVSSLLSITMDSMTLREKHCKENEIVSMLQKAIILHNEFVRRGNVDSVIPGNNLQFSRLEKKNSIDVLDSFSLVYRIPVENPLNIIFTNSVTEKYKEINNFLWKLKFAHKSLFLSRKACADMYKRIFVDVSNKRCKISNRHFFERLYALCFSINFKMGCFFTSLLERLFYSSLDSSLESFLEKCKTCTSISELISDHAQFINKLMEQLFLDKSNVLDLIASLSKTAIMFSRQCVSMNEAVVSLSSEESEERILKFIEPQVIALEENKATFESHHTCLMNLFLKKNIVLYF